MALTPFHNYLTQNLKHYSSAMPILIHPLPHASLTSELQTPSTIDVHSFIHSGHFYSAPSSPLLLRGAPGYSTDTVSEFHAEAHRQLQVKDLPKVPTWRLERES